MKLKDIIKEFSYPKKYDVVKFFWNLRGYTYPMWVVFMDDTHVALSLNKEPKKGEPMNTMGIKVHHIGELKNRPFYNELLNWMRSGNSSKLKNKTFVAESVNERSSYKDDPRWIKAKYAGYDVKGRPFKRGEEILYYPRTKKIFTGKEAEKAWKDFTSTRQDDDWMGSQFY